MDIKNFRSWCIEQGIVIKEQNKINYGEQMKLEKAGDKISVAFYTTGKFLIQGKESVLKEIIESKIGKVETKKSKQEAPEVVHNAKSWIGVDESGKGDFFGPLCVSACFIKKEQEEIIKNMGIQDSKKISDKKIYELALQLEKIVSYQNIVLMPVEYNKLYSKYNNLNHLLAEQHALLIADLAKLTKAPLAISDQFAKDKSLIENRLQSKKVSIQLIQQTKAEADLAVACASIFARREFLIAIKDMATEYGQNFSKGVSPKVKEEASDFIASFGRDMLSTVAKLHFKTANEV